MRQLLEDALMIVRHLYSCNVRSHIQRYRNSNFYSFIS